MPTHLIKIEKEDITTSPIGVNIQVTCQDGYVMIFSREALNELIRDYDGILKSESKEQQVKNSPEGGYNI